MMDPEVTPPDSDVKEETTSAGFPQPASARRGSAASHRDVAVSSQSCQFCRRRKIKCDKSLPVCNQCIKARQTCIYHPSQRRGRPRNTSNAVVIQEQSKDVLLKRIRKLEALVEDYKTEGTKPEGTTENVADPFGKLDICEPYLDDEFWNSRELTEAIAGSEESDEEENFVSPPSTTTASDFLWGVTPAIQDLSVFHPPKSQILHYWKVYLENCECLLRIIHTPTTEVFVKAFVDSDSQSPCDQSNELLLFCFYFAAITSLTDGEVRQQFGETKPTLLGRHELAVKHALSRSRFIYTQDIKVVQGLVLYLICIRQQDATMSSIIWNMTGLAFRIAQGMGMDRDGEYYKLSPFETEMRRRLWYQLLFLDLRAAETRGRLSALLRYDTRLPSNVNEDQLSPDMTVYPTSSTGPTDMTIPLMRFEIAKLGRRLQATDFRVAPLQPSAKKVVIEEFQKLLVAKYVQHCVGAGPLPEYCAKTAMMITARTSLVAYQGKARDASQDEKERLFMIGIEIMEYYEDLSKSTIARRWAWLLKIHVQWHAIAFILAELCSRMPSVQTDRAWRVIDATCGEWEPQADTAGPVIYNSVRKLLSKAQRRRDYFARSSVDQSVSPSFPDSPHSYLFGSGSGAHPSTEPSQHSWSRSPPEPQSSSYAAQQYPDIPMPPTSTFGQPPLGAGMPLMTASDEENLPDWFFGGGHLQDQQIPSYGAEDMAWNWTDQSYESFVEPMRQSSFSHQLPQQELHPAISPSFSLSPPNLTHEGTQMNEPGYMDHRAHSVPSNSGQWAIPNLQPFQTTSGFSPGAWVRHGNM